MIEGCNFKYEMDKEWKLAYSFFQSETYEVSFIFAQCLKENNGAIHIPFNVVEGEDLKFIVSNANGWPC